MILFGNMPQRSGTWAWFKALAASKSLAVQYDEDSSAYTVYGYDVMEVLSCTVWKSSVPDTAITAGYSQAQNDADKSVFETNYKPYANRSIAGVPSPLISQSISAALNVNGAVTPVVFEYNPPAGFDIEVSALSINIEDTGAFAFGNKFVLSTLASLTNGLLLEMKAGDVVFSPWANMQKTRDIFKASSDFSIVTSGTNYLRSIFHIPHPLRLARSGTYTNPDYIRITVRDDLTSLDYAELYLQGLKK